VKDEARAAGAPEGKGEILTAPPALPPGVLCVRLGPGANCSSAGSAIDVLFYGSVVASALAVALAAALPPREKVEAQADDRATDKPEDQDAG
jgi:hypothetical protein